MLTSLKQSVRQLQIEVSKCPTKIIVPRDLSFEQKLLFKKKFNYFHTKHSFFSVLNIVRTKVKIQIFATADQREIFFS